MPAIDPLSATSLRVVPMFGETTLATATAFTVSVSGASYLITNWHVVSGRHPDTGRCLDASAAIPDRLSVAFHSRGRLGSWQRLEIPLLSEAGEPLWLEHPLGQAVDVVAIRLEEVGSIDVYPLDLGLAATDVIVTPAMPALVIGYPLGLAAGENWPIWKTGHIASDPEIGFEPGKPAFLIDATTRKGMSGAPVVLRMSSGYTNKAGHQILGGGVVTKFLGVYAGRSHDQAEIGRVWRPFVIREVIEGRLLFDESTGRIRPSRNAACPCDRGNRFKYCCGAGSF